MEKNFNLPSNLQAALHRLASPFPAAQIRSLSLAVQEYGDSIVKAANASPFMDVPLALQVCQEALNILNRYPELDSDSQKWGAAAVKYFLMREDEINGFTTPGGFEDDALVMRAVSDIIWARNAAQQDQV